MPTTINFLSMAMNLFPYTTPARQVRDFRPDQSGNVSLLLAVAIVGAILTCGATIDFARLNSTRTALAAAVDSGVLSATSSSGEGADVLKEIADATLKANYNDARYGALLDTQLSVEDGNIIYSADVRFETTLMRLAGIDAITVPVSAQAVRHGRNLEVALVMDVTSSMSESEMATLKSAAIALMDTVQASTPVGSSSRFSLVPYADAVNLGDLAAAARGSIASGTCTSPGCEKYNFLSANGTTRKTFSASTCVTERTGTEAYTDSAISESPAGYYYDRLSVCSGNELVPLTDDRDTLDSAIADLTSGRYTAGQVGIAWGWYTLSPRFGLWSASETGAGYDDSLTTKVAVVMTDGQFNVAYCNGVPSANYSNELKSNRIFCDATNGSPEAQALALCTAMKAEGIEIYTVGFDLASFPDASALLSACASGSDHAYLAESSADLLATFSAIGESLVQVRLAR